MRKYSRFKSIQDFLSSLRYADLEYNLRNSSEAFLLGFPIFSEIEIVKEPPKWLKYLLLARVGLTTVENLLNDITKYPSDRVDLVQKQCADILQRQDKLGKQQMIVIKIVPMDRAGQLPNFRVLTERDLQQAIERIPSVNVTAHQIWICTPSITSGQFNLGGRRIYPSSTFSPIGITTQSASPSEIVEIVWYASPRVLEQIGHTNFAFPYLRGVRKPGQLAFSVEQLYIPAEKEIPNQTGILLSQFSDTMREFELRRDAIYRLLAVLFAAGAKEVSVEFRVSDGKFSVIDWDTEIESMFG